MGVNLIARIEFLEKELFRLKEEIKLSESFKEVKLTTRQNQVADLRLQGYTYKEIAKQLNLSLRTVKSHVSGLYTKLGITSGSKRVQLAIRLYRMKGDYPTESKPVELTMRQEQILDNIMLGLTNREIARQLGVARNTVQGTLCSLYDKVGLDNRVELAVWYEAHRPRLQEGAPI